MGGLPACSLFAGACTWRPYLSLVRPPPFADSRIPYTQIYYCHVAPHGLFARGCFIVGGEGSCERAACMLRCAVVLCWSGAKPRHPQPCRAMDMKLQTCKACSQPAG